MKKTKGHKSTKKNNKDVKVQNTNRFKSTDKNTKENSNNLSKESNTKNVMS